MKAIRIVATTYCFLAGGLFLSFLINDIYTIWTATSEDLIIMFLNGLYSAIYILLGIAINVEIERLEKKNELL